MKHTSGLYDALLAFVGQCAWSDQRHAYVLVWMVIGVIHEGSVNLTRWLSHVQTSAQQAQSTQRRFSRWIHNCRIHPTQLAPLDSSGASWVERSSFVPEFRYDDAVGYLLRDSFIRSLSRTSHSRDLASVGAWQ